MTDDVPDDVRGALAAVDRLPTLPVSDHVAVFEEIHRLLDGVLADLDGPVRPGGSGRAPA